MLSDEYVTKNYDKTNGKAYQDVAIKSLVDLGRTFAEDGKLHAVTYQPFTFLIMYNKDHFAKAGITKTSETWAKFKYACTKLKAAGYIPITTDNAYVDIIIGYQIVRYKDFDWVKTCTRRLMVRSSSFISCKDWKEMYKLGYISPITIRDGKKYILDVYFEYIAMLKSKKESPEFNKKLIKKLECKRKLLKI